ncbi:sigma 54-interacting transcriptional regulator [Proteiniborus sp. MB09-C3]|uniref:sigma-54 interaction domain-containing protein n=1 Tax=Proteiniborus sp. MB09-C3 TaxID=3050072 RepID=UPI002557815D|nr:sigma 54-interacting transcriptional regulator [Proteiniborus sp. MB09-C3]WIV11937.1 sigma 54-interacting transcriptional regulator [Proteiniborus sp. MB09-C3]
MKNNFITNEDMIKCIDESNDGIMISDAEGRILYVNASYLVMTKLDKSILGHNIDEYVSKGIITQSSCLSCIKYRRTYTHIHHEKNGVEIITVSRPIYSENGELKYTVTNVRDISSYVNLNQKLTEVNKKFTPSSHDIECGDQEIIANSPEMMQVINLAKTVSKVDASVLILGETGVGKDVIASYIHKKSPRANNRFITLNCGAIPGELMESELFGYTPGSFTGGLKEGKKGILHYAQNGTLFLDEIGELPQYLQVKLLRVLENRVYSPIGSVEEIPIDTRIIAATNQNIKEQILRNKFREDLYYRLSVVTINIPPLRERQADIIPLAVHFLKRYTSKYGIAKKLEVDTLIQLQQYDWPGNVRELKNMIEKMVILSQGNTLDFPSSNNVNREEMSKYKLKEYMEHTEKEYLCNVKDLFSSTRQMAEAIGVDHSTVVRKFKKYNL